VNVAVYPIVRQMVHRPATGIGVFNAFVADIFERFRAANSIPGSARALARLFLCPAAGNSGEAPESARKARALPRPKSRASPVS
jgi:hypothetical protein